jgi:hypothetical protein
VQQDSMSRKNAPSTRGRPFAVGNPGRPQGSRNRSTVLAEQLMASDIEGVVKRVIEAAMEGDMTAAKLVLDRIAPIRKDQPMTLEIPRTADAQGVAEASAEVVAAVADGLITPEEGQVLSQILEARRRAIETSEHEQRLEALEKTLESRREST